MSVRMQIYLSDEQYKQLKQKSRLTGKPMAEYVRESLGKYLDEIDQPREHSEDPIWQISGQGKSQNGDLSTHHDRYLYGDKKGEES